MTRASWLLLCALALETGCGLQLYTAGRAVGPSVTSLRYRGTESMIVDVQLQDGASYPFLLDTGMAITIVDEDLVRRLGLRRRGRAPLQDLTQGKKERLGAYRLESLALGEATFADVGVVAIDGPWNGTSCTDGFAGVLGSNVLAHGVLEIDARSRIVELATGDARLPARPGGATYPFTAGHRYPMIEVPVFGEPVRFLFDTGNPTTIDVVPSLASRFAAGSPSVECTSETTGWGIYGAETGTPQPCRTVAWPAPAGAAFAGVVAQEANTSMLGTGLLPYFTARVDYRAGTVSLWRNDEPIATGYTSHGVDLACDGAGNMFVQKIWQKSAAAMAGVRASDRVTGVVADGQRIASLCGCDTACGCGGPSEDIASAETIEVTFANRKASLKLSRTDLLAPPT